MTRTATVLTVAGVTAVAGIVAYAAYFDYKRRNDAAFRKKLRTLSKSRAVLAFDAVFSRQREEEGAKDCRRGEIPVGPRWSYS